MIHTLHPTKKYVQTESDENGSYRYTTKKDDMNWIYTIIIFAVVLLLYIHINEQWRKSQQLEIYEMDYTNQQQLSEICRIKQPVLFELPGILEDGGNPVDNTDVVVKDTHDYAKPEPVDGFALTYSAARTLFQTDETGRYFMENTCFENHSKMVVCGKIDGYLKPISAIYAKHELLAGSKGAATPLKYHTSDRKFIAVLQGRIRIMMTPWKSEKLLNPIHDYENYEFRSIYNPWKMTDGRLKFLEFDIHPGYVLYVPPYWWFSLQFVESETNAVSVQYNSVQNLLANGKHIALYYLQQSNITEKPARTLEIQINNDGIKESKPESESKPPLDETKDPLTILKEGNHGRTTGPV